MKRRGIIGAAIVAALAAAAPAQAAKQCAEPGATWERATPAEAAMDGRKLQDAMDYATTQASFSVRVYRNGCLVGEDRSALLNREGRYESWSMAKSVTSLVFGRAMELGLISPEDPIGSVVPEADAAHGDVRVRDLLTMTSGLRWTGLRDYNIFTMPDRIRDALTLDVVRPRGTYFEYAQSPVSLLAEGIGRSAGEDIRGFAQRELMDPLGIPDDAWFWRRDSAGHVGGFWGVNMRPDDFGRLGELMRRGGVWRGRRLLDERFVREAVTPTPTNGCYGWLIWVNRGAPCIGPTITDRPETPNRDMPDMPVDMYRFSGLFGQLVTVFPSQGLVVVRTGQDPNLVFAGGQGWEHELYRRVLGSLTDGTPVPAGDRKVAERPNADYGFQTALKEPDQVTRGLIQAPLPAAGPQRARAARLSAAQRRAGRKGRLAVALQCPPRWPSGLDGCRGTATLTGARKAVPYAVAPGQRGLVRFRLKAKRLRALKRKRVMTLTVVATNADRAQGVATRERVTVRRPLKPKRRAKAKRKG